MQKPYRSSSADETISCSVNDLRWNNLQCWQYNSAKITTLHDAISQGLTLTKQQAVP